MTEKSFVVWGDSHAAHLMPGLKSVFEIHLTLRRELQACAHQSLGFKKMTGRIAKTSMIW